MRPLSKKLVMKYTYRGSTVDFGQPNQKGQGQTKEQWIDARLASGAFSNVTATDAEKKAALADAWDKLAEERGEKKAADPAKTAKPNQN